MSFARAMCNRYVHAVTSHKLGAPSAAIFVIHMLCNIVKYESKQLKPSGL